MVNLFIEDYYSIKIEVYSLSKTITILTAGVFEQTYVNTPIYNASWVNTDIEIFYLDKETGKHIKLNTLEYPIVNIKVSYSPKTE
jgi:hypothetical protein